MTFKDASQVANQLEALRHAIKDTAFSPDYKLRMLNMIDAAIASGKPAVIEMTMRNIGSIVFAKAAQVPEPKSAIQEKAPIPEGITKAEPKEGGKPGALEFTSEQIWAAVTSGRIAEKPPVYESGSIRGVVENKGHDLESEKRENQLLQNSNPVLWKIKYGDPDSAFLQLKDEKGVFVAVYGVNELKEPVPRGIITKMFYDSDSVRITESVAKKAYAHYERELGDIPNEVHRTYVPVGEFAKIRIESDIGMKVHAIAFYDCSSEAMGRIANATPSR